MSDNDLNFDLEKISSKLTKDAYKFIEDICNYTWTRLPGSANENKAQDYIKEKYRAFGFQEISELKFGVHSKYFLWWPRLSVIFYILSLLFYFPIPLISFIFALASILNIIFKVFSFIVFDIFFKKHPSKNVVGKIKAINGPPKRLLIIGGHIDSNYVYPLGEKYGVKGFLFVIPAALFMLISIIGSLIHFIVFFIKYHAYTIFSLENSLKMTELSILSKDIPFILSLIGVFYVVWIGFKMITNKASPGANDNLSGLSVVSIVSKYLIGHPEIYPKNLEIWCMSFGSEEGGMMGSKTMAKIVKKEIDSFNSSAEQTTGENSGLYIPTSDIWVINFDSIAANGPLLIATAEPMYRVKYVPVVYNALSKSAERSGVPYICRSLAAGTDSSPFGRKNIPATGIVNMGDGTKPPNWHSLKDTPQNLEKIGIKNSIKLLLQFILDLDKSLE
ncbi:MAG: M28 family peptidase [Promethearchaeota archaeon]